MEKEKKLKEIPGSFVYCLEKDCALAGTCLRQMATKYINPEQRILSVISPAYVKKGEGCPDYLSDDMQKVAFGLKYFYANLPHHVAIDLKCRLMNYFGRSAYYRIGRKERGLTPADQDYIKGLFSYYKLKQEPKYEYYEFKFVLNNRK